MARQVDVVAYSVRLAFLPPPPDAVQNYLVGCALGSDSTARMSPTAPGVREALVTALADAGVAELTPIQTGVLPHVLAGSDVLAKAKTGTGKTFAFLMPTVERLLRNDAAALPGGVDPVRALVLSSARELGTQIFSQAEKLTAGLADGSFTIETIMGGSSITPQRERLDPALVGSSCKYGGRIDLMIATPGRLIEHSMPHRARTPD